MRICNLTELADYTRISASLLRKDARKGKIPCIRVNRRILFDLDLIDRWLAAHVTGASDPDTRIVAEAR